MLSGPTIEAIGEAELFKTPPTTDQPTKRHKTDLYPMNPFVKDRPSTLAFLHGVESITHPYDLRKNSNLMYQTAGLAARIFDGTMRSVEVEQGKDPVHTMKVYMYASTCLAVKFEVDTDACITDLLDRMNLYGRIKRNELVQAEAIILQATNWLANVRAP